MDIHLRNLVTLATVFGLGYHLDHILRGNHVGWPITSDIIPFTYSLGFYPVILLGWYLTKRSIVGPGFWSILAAVGAIVVGVLLLPFQSRATSSLAVFGLMAFLDILMITAFYGAYAWIRNRKSTNG